MLAFSLALLLTLFLHNKLAPLVLDFPFSYDKSKNRIVIRQRTAYSNLRYRCNILLQALYLSVQIIITASAPGDVADKAIALVLLLPNCITICLRWEFQPDPVPAIVINWILEGRTGIIVYRRHITESS